MLFLLNIIHLRYLGNCINYSNHPNLLLIVKSNKKIDDNEIIKPKIIRGFDFSLTLIFGSLADEDVFLSSCLSLLRRFENSLLTLKINFS